MAGTAGSTTRHKSFPVGVTTGTIAANKMAVIGTVIIRVVACLRVACLADSVPRLIIIIEGKVFWPLLENRKVKSTVNVPCFFPDEA